LVRGESFRRSTAGEASGSQRHLIDLETNRAEPYSPHPGRSLLYPIIPFSTDSAWEECSATTIGPQPDESQFLFLDNSA
jgi:hypothetical protein